MIDGHRAQTTVTTAPALCQRLIPKSVLTDFAELIIAEEEIEPGLTVRWGITPNINLLGTLNPDFSQVEADAAQAMQLAQRLAALETPAARPQSGDRSASAHTIAMVRTARVG